MSTNVQTKSGGDRMATPGTQLEITFKNGMQVTVDVDDWELIKRASGAKSLTWSTPVAATRQLVTFDMDEVVAIVRIALPAPGAIEGIPS